MQPNPDRLSDDAPLAKRLEHMITLEEEHAQSCSILRRDGEILTPSDVADITNEAEARTTEILNRSDEIRVEPPRDSV